MACEPEECLRLCVRNALEHIVFSPWLSLTLGQRLDECTAGMNIECIHHQPQLSLCLRPDISVYLSRTAASRSMLFELCSGACSECMTNKLLFLPQNRSK